MGIVNFIKNKLNPPVSGLTKEEFDSAKKIFESIATEIKKQEGIFFSYKISSYDSYIQLKNGDSTNKRNVCLYCTFLIVSYKRNYNSVEYTINTLASSLLSLLLKSNITFSDADYTHIINEITSFLNIDSHDYYIYHFPYSIFLNSIEKNSLQNGLSEDLKESILSLVRPNYNREDVKINGKINELTKDKTDVKYLVDDYIVSKDAIGQSLFNYFSETAETKNKLLVKLSEGVDVNVPTKKWLSEIKTILEDVEKKQELPLLLSILEQTTKFIENLHKEYNSQFLWSLNEKENLHFGSSKSNRWFFDKNEQILRGLAWVTALIDSKEYSDRIYDIAIVSYKKKAGIGALLPRLGGACIYGLAQLPFHEGSGYLTNLNQKIKNTNANKSIEKYLQELAVKSGKTKYEIEDESVSGFGLNKNSELIQTFGLYTVILRINNFRKIETEWISDGKSQKSVPIEVKSNFSNELKIFQQKVKKISESISIQSSRIEGFFLKNRSWQFTSWANIFLNNGLLASISKSLIWYFEKENQKAVAIYRNSQWIDNQEKEIDWIDETTKVQLWHPLGFEPNFIFKWRQLLEKWQILQPFKQAYREIYIITEAELNTQTYSNRFAAHILKNYQFGALLKIRNWGGYNQFHDGGVPEINLKDWKIKVQFWVDFVNGDTRWGDYISTDQVKFINQNGDINLTDVPALVFSETMRDIDLFVGVCSIGNDPNWRDGGNRFGGEYWQSYSFGDLGELAKTRKEVLERLISRLKIAKVSEVKDKFLIVKGKLRTYKIHIGSGNILMEPNDQYLCIVPDRNSKSSSADKLFIPFEGDNVLSIILSKAFMLVDDNKITDETIIRQIKT